MSTSSGNQPKVSRSINNAFRTSTPSCLSKLLCLTSEFESPLGEILPALRTTLHQGNVELSIHSFSGNSEFRAGTMEDMSFIEVPT